MKNYLRFFGVFTLLTALCFGSANAQNVMFVVGNKTDVEVSTGESIHERDSLVFEKMVNGNLALTVTLIDHDQTSADPADEAVATAIDNSDVIVISSSVSSGNVAGNALIMEGDLPILSLEYGTWDDQLMYSGDQNDLELDNFILTMGEDAPPEASGALGAEVLFGDTAVNEAKARFPIGDAVLCAGAEVYGWVTMNDTLYPAYIYADAGAQLINPDTGEDTTATRNYAQMMYGLLEPGSAGQITDDGWEIYERALCILLEQDHPFDDNTSILPTITKEVSFWYANQALYFDLDRLMNSTEIQIFDVTGKLMLHKKVSANEAIGLSHFENGIYIVRGEGFAGKFVKQ